MEKSSQMLCFKDMKSLSNLCIILGNLYFKYIEVSLLNGVLFCNLFYVFGIFKKYKEKLKIVGYI